MVRVTLGGPELAGLVVDQPAASVRLLLPAPGTEELVLPAWNGNEFLLADGTRPIIRTFTPRRLDPDRLELDLEMVIHDGGIAADWATESQSGAAAAVSGPGRGYVIDTDVPEYVLIGDETALPAISQLLERIPHSVPVSVHLEIAEPAARIPLPVHPLAVVEWHTLPPGRAAGESLVRATRRADIDPTAVLWCAGEAAAMHAIRKHVFEDLGIARSQATIRGYWKSGVRGGAIKRPRTPDAIGS